VILLRTLLFVPGNQERRIEKARSISTDALILDLEDSVPLAEKDAARAMVSSFIDGLTLSGREIFVRINALSTDHAIADIKAIVISGLSGICLNLTIGSIRLLALVETPKGIINAYEIAGASPRVFGIAFGPEDYALEMGIKRTREGAEIYYPRVVIAVACHAAGILAIDGVYTDIRDEEGLSQETGLARQMGFHGKLLIHPNQISPVSQIFSPTEEELRMPGE